MCPICAATVVATVAGSSSAGGVAAMVVRKLRPGARVKTPNQHQCVPPPETEAAAQIPSSGRK